MKQEKDAPCLCKDESFAFGNYGEIKRSGILTRLFQKWTKKCYPAEIAYTDGMISQLKSDREERTVFGVVFRGFIVTLRDAPEIMTQGRAAVYARNQLFFERKGLLGAKSFWKKISSTAKGKKVGKMLEKLGGDNILCCNRWYWVDAPEDDEYAPNWNPVKKEWDKDKKTSHTLRARLVYKI